MTLVLKTNKSASNSISTLLSAVIPNDYAISANFTSQKFTLTKDEPVAIGSVSSVTRGLGAGYVDKDGAYKAAPANTHRFHFSDTDGGGLLVEPLRTNALPTPSAPASGTYSVTTNRAQYLIMQVWGTGSAIFKVADMFEVEVFEGKPYSFFVPSAQTMQVQVVIEGSVTFYQAITSLNNVPSVTKVTSSVNEFVYLNVPPSNQKFSFVLSRKVLTGAQTNRDRNTEAYPFNFLQILDATSGMFALADVFAKDAGGATKVVNYPNGSPASVNFGQSIDNNRAEIEYLVVTLDTTTNTLKVAKNGAIDTVQLTGITWASGVNRIVLGNSITAQLPSNSSPTMFKEYYYYNRLLTDAEMLGITQGV